jgi:hypothetical protein
MRRKRKIALSMIGLLVAAATSAHAQHTCTLDGQPYPENATVCSGGLLLFCTNGTWQNNEGARCEGPTGAYVGPRRPLQERNAEPVPKFYKDKYPDLNLQ